MSEPTQESSEPEEPAADATPTPEQVAEDHQRFNDRWPNAQIR